MQIYEETYAPSLSLSVYHDKPLLVLSPDHLSFLPSSYGYP